jgi:hypothetical protein
MAHAVYDVWTNLDPLQLMEVASSTFHEWLKFALGQEALGGKKLAHPSGRYASAIYWKRTGAAKVSIIADEDAIQEVGAIEYGHPSVSMKDHMLGGGNTHMSKDGYRYRVIPLRPDQWRPTPTLSPGMTLDNITGGRVRKGVAKMWATPRPYVDSKSRFATMSDRPGSSPWVIPEFHPYAPASILAELLDEEFGRWRQR